MSGEFSILSNIDAFLVGMDSASRKPKKGEKFTTQDIVSQTRSTMDTMDKDFRQVYDRLIPNIHILDARITANLLLDALYNNPEKFIDFIEVNTDSKAGPITGLPNEIKQEVQNKLSPSVRATIVSKVISAISQLHKKVYKESEPDPIYALNQISQNIFSNLQNVVVSEGILEAAKVAAIITAGRDFKSAVNSIFGNRAIIGAVNTDLGSSDTVFVFYASSFTGSKSRINSVISDSFTEALKSSNSLSKSYNISKSIQVGTFINFAHSTVKVGTDNFLNSPSYAKLMYNVAQNPARNKKSPFSEALRASDHFKIKTGQIKIGVKVSKNFTDNTNVLAQLGMTITVSEDEAANKAMGILEGMYGSGIYKSTQKSTQAFRSSVLSRQIEKIAISLFGGINALKGTSSPSVGQYLDKKFSNIFKNIKATNEKYSTNKQKAIPVTFLKKGIKSKVATVVVQAPSIAYPKVQFSNTLKSSIFYSLINLQSLINDNLQNVISANMGNGSSRNTLNYQTGRFAASANVERMSQSREGMITAFYSYMKNPYQTFEPGFRQGSPKTRDPKLLIAKSIREIAATKVGNRLRAVSV